MKEQYKKMYDFVLPARRKAKSEGDIASYSRFIKRQLELLKEFYHIADEAIDDAYADPDKFEDSMEHWAETDPSFTKQLEDFMEKEAMMYYADKLKAEGREAEVTLEKVIELNKGFVEIFNGLDDVKFGEVEKGILIDVKFNWALDELFETHGLDLGVEKLVKDRFENKEYYELRKKISEIYEKGE
jgi:hypothetical protein